MDTIVLSALVGAAALVVGIAASYVVLGMGARDVRRRAGEAAEHLREQAENRAREIELEAQQSAIHYREEIDDELRDQRREATRVERRLEQREEGLERRAEGLERGEHSLRDRVTASERREADFESEQEKLRTELERVAGLTTDEARDLLLERLDGELRDESARRVRAMETAAKAEADMRGRKILATVMQRMTLRDHGGGDRLRGADPLRRAEGADHRSRGAQHPRLRGRHGL